MWAAPRENHNRIFIVLMAAIVALAWLALWVLGRPPDGLFYDHHGGELGAFGSGGAFMLVFVAGWTVMVVAMMLPTSLPLISMFRAIVGRKRDRTLLVTLLVTGYLGIWTLFGIGVYFGGWVLRLLLERSAWLEANAWALGAGVLLLAGVYQFTPLKYHCLDKCRSPLSFITEHWRGSRERSQAFLLGTHHGLFCVGCCWSLMLLMFLVGGVGSFGWMLVLGAVMAVEKNVSWGRRIGAPLGVLLVGLGVTLGTASALQSSGDTVARIALDPASDSGVSGVATLTDNPDGVEVRLDVRRLPEPGATYVAHMHPGSCAGASVAEVKDHTHGHHGDHAAAREPTGGIEHPLEPIVAGSGGHGSSITLMEGPTVRRLASGEGHYLDVHDRAAGPEELPHSLACGTVPEHGEGH